MGAPDVLHEVIAHARRDPQHLAAKDLDRELSYGQLVDEAAQLGAGLVARGVVEGDRVALLIANSVDFVVMALASLWVGAIFVPLAVTDPEARLAAIVGDCDPRVVVSSDAVEGAPAAATLGGVAVTAISELRHADRVEPLAVSPRPAYAIYTSGTTGTPKGVLIGTTAFAAAVSAASTALGLSPSTRTLCVSPFHFDGSFGTVFTTLYRGGLAVMRPRDALLFARTFFNTVDGESITFSGFTPSYLRILLASPEVGRLADSTLATVALGGEACLASDLVTLWSWAPRLVVFNRYGPTETTIAVTHQELAPRIIADGTVPIGVPHPGVSFFLVDENGDVIGESDRVGELYIGGDQLMDRYWNAPDLTAAVLRRDVVPGETLYRSGDLVFRGGDGRYVYVDRADRVIKRSGVRISLIEMGDVLRSLDGVTAAACVTFDHDGELGIVAFVITDRAVSSLDLWRAARVRLPDTMLPDRIDLVDSLPMNKSNKLDERLLLSNAGLAAFQPLSQPGRSSPST